MHVDMREVYKLMHRIQKLEKKEALLSLCHYVRTRGPAMKLMSGMLRKRDGVA